MHTTTILLRRACIILHYSTHTRQVVCPNQPSSRIVKYEKLSQVREKYVSCIIQSSTSSNVKRSLQPHEVCFVGRRCSSGAFQHLPSYIRNIGQCLHRIQTVKRTAYSKYCRDPCKAEHHNRMLPQSCQRLGQGLDTITNTGS